MVDKKDYLTINKLREKWLDYNSDSLERGKKNLEFSLKNEQWEQDRPAGCEELIFNLIQKQISTVQANAKNIELSLNIFSRDKEPNTEELSTFQALLKHIMLSGDNLRAFGDSFDSLVPFGQSVLFVSSARESQDTLNKMLSISYFEDVKRCFFDTKAASTRQDGRFCGFSTSLSKKEFKEIYGKRGDGVPSTEVIDFYYKEPKKVEFIKLETGEYKRVSLLNSRDEPISNTIIKKTVNLVYYTQVCKHVETPLIKPRCLNIDILPMVLEDGFTHWTGEKFESYPLGYYLYDTQKLLNFLGSQMADISKTAVARKFIFPKDMLINEEGKSAAENINTVHGILPFYSKPGQPPVQVFESPEIPPTLDNLFNGTQSLLQNLSGAAFDGSQGEVSALSGVALDKLFSRVDLVQSNAIVSHEKCINIIGQIVQQMIPFVYTENRILQINESYGNITTIEINKKSYVQSGVTGANLLKIENNVKDIRSKYNYRLFVRPSEDMQKQNTMVILSKLYEIWPQALPSTIDIYIRSLDIQDAAVLAKRLSVNVPPALVKYGDGEITYQQYMKQTQAQQQQQMQEQMMMASQSPQGQLAEAKAQSDKINTIIKQREAATKQFIAETERIALDLETQQTNLNTQLQVAETVQDQHLRENQQHIDVAKHIVSNLEANAKRGL